MFLDSVREKQEAAERERKERDGEEVKSFREYVVLLLIHYQFIYVVLKFG